MKVTKLLCIILVFFIVLPAFSREDTAWKKYPADWDSLRARPYPQWFSDVKLGIFIHWGVYSVPAYGSKESYGEWFLRGLQVGDTLRHGFQNRVYGDDFHYREYAPLFRAELFNPREWANLFKRAGAGYVILVSKHHDGYCLWPSKQAPGWNSVDVGPKRDLVGDLSKAVREAGLKMGLYYSLTEWNNPLHRWYTDPNENIGPYVENHMIPQFKDLIGTYKPSLIFSDGEWFNKADEFHAAELISWYYNLVGPEAIINNRWGGGSDIGFLTPEYSAGISVTDRPWAECRGIGRSFGLNRNEPLDNYMSPKELIHFFIKAVANGGGITLNVGPKADGQIPLLQQERLLQLGEWLEINGEAIYGSSAWQKTGEERTYTLERVDPEINFNWVRNTPGQPISEDNFRATWTGFIQPDHSTEYQFSAWADEGIRVWVDGKLLIDQSFEEENNGEESVANKQDGNTPDGKIRLKKGKKYPIKIKYFEKKVEAVAKLFWESKKHEKEIVPQKNLFTAETLTNGDGLSGQYSSQGQYVCYTVNNDALYAIALEWPETALALNLPGLSPDAEISLLGSDGKLKWQYDQGKLKIDVSEITYNQMPGHTAWTFKISNSGLLP